MLTVNLPNYLLRIGHTGALAPTLDVLRDVVYGHATSIPFENLNPFLGLPVSLEIADVERKLVEHGRGGYCFEQNLLLWEALSAMGFEVSGLAARVLWMRPETDLTPRGHMLLRVEIEGQSYLVDVGFGGFTLTGALQLAAEVEQPTPHEPFRLLRNGDDWRMQARVGEEWRSLYRFDLQPQHPIDYHAANYFTSTHPTSHFVTGLIAARPAAGVRYALRNREFTTYRIGMSPETRKLQSAAEIRATLENIFGITVPAAWNLMDRIESLA